MAINYASQFDTRSPKRSNRVSTFVKTKENQVQNSEGAFVWSVNDWDRLNRFLILGAEGGTYYVAERDLVKSNHDAILKCIQSDGKRTVAAIVDVSVKGRAYKNDPAIFALALCSAHGDAATKEAAHKAIPRVCRIGTHIQHFVKFASALRGMGRGLRNGIANWYTSMDADKLAYQAVKYQARDGWSHRDLIRQAHPKALSDGQDAVFRWIVGGKPALGPRVVKGDKSGRVKEREFAPVEALPDIISAFEEAKTASTTRLIALIAEHNLPREAVPTEKLNEVKVWEALLEKMPLNAMVRNLGKMSSIGLVKPLSAATATVCKRLREEKYLLKSRVHPMQILLAAKTYETGHGLKGKLTWTPVPAISTALDEAFYLTFPNVKPVGKPVLIALDVSASMSCGFGGTPLSSCEAVTALSLVHANVEPDTTHIFGFNLGMQELPIRKGMSIKQAMKHTDSINGGGTNVSLAYEYAIEHKLDVGGFVVMTDSETNAGHQPHARLRQYREKFVGDARSVVVATTSTNFTINDPDDKWGLDVAGFDTSVPAMISDFIRGDTDEPKESAGQEAEAVADE